MRGHVSSIAPWYILFFLIGASSLIAAPVAAQWTPQKNVEIVAMSGPGGANDVIARAVQRVIQQQKLVDAPVTVISKVGGGGVLAWTYLNQHAGDGAYLSISPINLLTEHILGASPISYRDVTPLAQLFDEYVAFSVRADSPIQDGRDLVRRIAADPKAVSFAVAASLGGANHIATALAMKAAGADVRKLKFVVFTSGGQSVTAVMGGHVDVAVTPASGAARQMQGGRLRVIALSAPQRFGGALSAVPTWKENGVNSVFSSPRGVIGPKGMTGEQIAYWEGVLARVVQAEAWKADAQKNYWSPNFMKSAQSTNYLKARYDESRAVLADLGLAR
jgi:putative tricarboxylic transport membrane protein